NSNFLK
ncbi:hypothetical protein ACN38_g13250, partial [Penicillium nordicum]